MQFHQFDKLTLLAASIQTPFHNQAFEMKGY